MNDEIREIEIWKEKTKGIFHITEYRRFWNNISSLQHENKILKSLINSIHYDELHHYKFLRDIKDIIRDKEVGYMETCDILETVINKELEKYE